jgi:hypothetical protein
MPQPRVYQPSNTTRTPYNPNYPNQNIHNKPQTPQTLAFSHSTNSIHGPPPPPQPQFYAPVISKQQPYQQGYPPFNQPNLTTQFNKPMFIKKGSMNENQR